MSFCIPITIITWAKGIAPGIINPHGEGFRNLEFGGPQNTHSLQIFLGIMVYFLAYIPFYAWIAAPLFNLFKKDDQW
jgi:hypothetical protein